MMAPIMADFNIIEIRIYYGIQLLYLWLQL